MYCFVLVMYCFVLVWNCSEELGLQKRIEYLSRATINAKSCTQNAADGQLLDELEEKLEVSCLQVQVYEAMTALKRPELKHQCNRLNSQLMDITMVSIDTGIYTEIFYFYIK